MSRTRRAAPIVWELTQEFRDQLNVCHVFAGNEEDGYKVACAEYHIIEDLRKLFQSIDNLNGFLRVRDLHELFHAAYDRAELRT